MSCCVCAWLHWGYSIFKCNVVMLTFICAVSKRAGSAHAARPLFQWLGASAQSVSLPVELERIMCWNTIRATHTGAREIELGHIGGTHCSQHKYQNITYKRIFWKVVKTQLGSAQHTQVWVVVFASVSARCARWRKRTSGILQTTGGMGA